MKYPERDKRELRAFIYINNVNKDQQTFETFFTRFSKKLIASDTIIRIKRARETVEVCYECCQEHL